MTPDTTLTDAVARRERCRKIARRLRLQGWSVDWKTVNRNYVVFRRWDTGYISTGYLVRLTGIKRKQEGQ